MWDVFPEGERLGGAPFNFAAHSARLGQYVRFIGAVGSDERGTRAVEQAQRLGVNTEFLARVEGLPTGYVTVSIDAQGQPDYVIHHPVAYDAITLSDEQLQAVADFAPDWIYYGTLEMISPGGRATFAALLHACGNARRFYDVNLRKQSFTPALVRDLIGLADVVKLNQEEVRSVAGFTGVAHNSTAGFCQALAHRNDLKIVCVTRGERGCAVWTGEGFVEADGVPVTVTDAVGAGDAFAAAFVHGLSQAWPIGKVCEIANRLGALVASRAGAVPDWTPGELQ